MESDNNHHHHHTEEALTQLRLAMHSLETIETMIRAEKPCTEVVRRLSGVLAALTECRGLIAKDHVSSCLQSALEPGQEKVLNEVSLLFQELLKGPLPGSHH